MNVVDFSHSHLGMFTIRKEQPVVKYIDNLVDYGILLEKNTYRPRTVFINDEVLFVGGIITRWGTCGEGYFLFSDKASELFKHHGRDVIKGTREYIENSPYTRVETPCPKDFVEAQKFLRVIGFKQEGLMRKYGPQEEDMYLYSWIRE